MLDIKLRISVAVILLVLAAVLVGCRKTEPGNDSGEPNVRLRPTAVAPNVFSIAGEVCAFEAEGEPGTQERVAVLLQSVRARVGGFPRANVFEFDESGKSTNSWILPVDPGGSMSIDATAGRHYLVYGQLGVHFNNTYRVLCFLNRIRIARTLIPRICATILCAPDMFMASDLVKIVPELARYQGIEGLPDQPIGGFGGDGGFGVPGGLGGGSICDQCFGPRDGVFYPVEECNELVLPRPVTSCGAGDRVVYVHRPFPWSSEWGKNQIYAMDGDGGNPTNLSNNDHWDSSPDVDPTGQSIVFRSSRLGPSIFTMDITGGNVTAVPNTQWGYLPKWNSQPGSSILYVYPGYTPDSAIWSILLDGTNRVQRTFPDSNHRDEYAVDLNGKNIVFVRVDTTNWNRDLYLKYIWDNSPPVQLTNTVELSEVITVVSHCGDKIAYRVFFGGGRDDEVHVANFAADRTLNVLHTIDLDLPADINISGIDFSADDRCLFISTQASDVPGNLINRKQEVFSVELDGSNQYRLTNNTDSDCCPSVVPK